MWYTYQLVSFRIYPTFHCILKYWIVGYSQTQSTASENSCIKIFVHTNRERETCKSSILHYWSKDKKVSFVCLNISLSVNENKLFFRVSGDCEWFVESFSDALNIQEFNFFNQSTYITSFSQSRSIPPCLFITNKPISEVTNDREWCKQKKFLLPKEQPKYPISVTYH